MNHLQDLDHARPAMARHEGRAHPRPRRLGHHRRRRASTGTARTRSARRRAAASGTGGCAATRRRTSATGRTAGSSSRRTRTTRVPAASVAAAGSTAHHLQRRHAQVRLLDQGDDEGLDPALDRADGRQHPRALRDRPHVAAAARHERGRLRPRRRPARRQGVLLLRARALRDDLRRPDGGLHGCHRVLLDALPAAAAAVRARGAGLLLAAIGSTIC